LSAWRPAVTMPAVKSVTLATPTTPRWKDDIR
jgi:hypothetical protein